MKKTGAIFLDLPVSIFARMSALATAHNAVNLGQGFPDTDGPEWIRREAAQGLVDGPNQYPPAMGVPALRKAVAGANRRFYGLDIDPDTEVLVTSGATEALMDCCLALLDPGDEAIVIEPFYDSYPVQIRAAGGVPKFVRLSPPEWKLDEKALRAAFSSKTKFILLNTPLNPAAKVFTREELDIIAKLLIEFDAYAVCDEVYEHLLFDDRAHIPLMTLPGMRDRCIRIGSAGKTFSLTGWKIGYVTAPAPLLKAVASVHQYATFATPPALQMAVAKGLASEDAYYEGLVSQMEEGRRILAAGLERIGFAVLPCEGTYFLTVDFAPLGYEGDDLSFCEWMTKEAGVAAIPLSAFYHANPPRSLIRFCFAKKRSVLEDALKRLGTFFAAA